MAEDARKKVPSSVGMRRGVETSELLRFRAEEIVPKRADEMSAAIAERDFEKFAQITMKDSNQVRLRHSEGHFETGNISLVLTASVFLRLTS